MRSHTNPVLGMATKYSPSHGHPQAMRCGSVRDGPERVGHSIPATRHPSIPNPLIALHHDIFHRQRADRRDGELLDPRLKQQVVARVKHGRTTFITNFQSSFQSIFVVL